MDALDGPHLGSGAFVNDRPRHAKFVPELAEACGKECFRQRRVNLSAFSKELVDSLRLFCGIERKVKVDASDFLKHCGRDVVCDQYRISDFDPRMDDRFSCALWSSWRLTLIHHHDDLSAKVLFVEVKGLFTITAKVQVRIKFHRYHG